MPEETLICLFTLWCRRYVLVLGIVVGIPDGVARLAAEAELMRGRTFHWEEEAPRATVS
jgi:hypothetical protein